jgi:hypothetical protein
VSHIATNWAFQVKGLKPATKIVLLYLADRHNPDYGCFPSIGRLADDCEISPRSAHTHIDTLENLGLIKRIARHRADGKKSSNEYLLNFTIKQIDHLQELQIPTAKNADGNMQNLQIINPVINNLVNNTYYLSEAFEKAWRFYPRKIGKGAALKSFQKALKQIHGNELLSKIEEYSLAIGGSDIKYIPHLSTWLNQERWNDELPEKNQNIDKQFRNMVNDLARVSR